VLNAAGASLGIFSLATLSPLIWKEADDAT